ncbi:MAG: DUF3047 domain-containing protein [Thermodesulfobacteriota bacterium]|nr:DUF3047 domain-containing protein [Thermodesulfobacteriota bacterium]
MKSDRSFLSFSLVTIFILTLTGATIASGSNALTAAGFDSEKMEKSAPSGWELVEKAGTVNLDLEKVDDSYALRMTSNSESSFGIKKEIKVKTAQYPFLSWKWKVAKLPIGADIRDADADDQAIQIYVAFKPTGWPVKLKTPTIGYIWGVECPKDTIVTSPQLLASKVRYIVLRNKTDELNIWYHQKRNLKEDYQKLFPDIDGGQPRDIEGISFYINSQHTKSEAESCIYDVRFSRD